MYIIILFILLLPNCVLYCLLDKFTITHSFPSDQFYGAPQSNACFNLASLSSFLHSSSVIRSVEIQPDSRIYSFNRSQSQDITDFLYSESLPKALNQKKKRRIRSFELFIILASVVPFKYLVQYFTYFTFILSC